MTDTQKAASAAVAKKTPAVPQDRKPSAADRKAEEAAKKQQEKVMADFMSAGLDFTPLTIDAGDGLEWQFVPDLMPPNIQRLRAAVQRLHASNNEVLETGDGGDTLQEAFDELVEACRQCLEPDLPQPAEWPRPNYGIKALLWFAMHLIQGKTGFPTE